MSRRIPTALRQAVTVRDDGLCAYCLSRETLLGMPFEVDHIIPLAAGGETTLDNICLCCPRCNRHKAGRTQILDSETGNFVPLFHPLRDSWHAHFAWEDSGAWLTGLTATGRATIAALRINRPQLVAIRHYWIALGLHPPHR